LFAVVGWLGTTSKEGCWGGEVRWTQMDCGRGERREKDSGRGEWRDSGVRKSYLGAGLSPITGWDFRGGALSAVPKCTSPALRVGAGYTPTNWVFRGAFQGRSTKFLLASIHHPICSIQPTFVIDAHGLAGTIFIYTT